MSNLKSLAGQTLWYGLSNIAARLLNVLLTPLLTHILNTPKGQADFGDFSIIYALISFANVVYTYGMETAYFRFSADKTIDRGSLWETAFGSLILSTIGFSALLIFYRAPVAAWAGFAGHSEYITLAVLIIATDTLAAIPFARLRQEGRPKKYAFIRLAGIVVNIILTVLFIAFSPKWVAAHPHNAYSEWYRGYSNPALIFIANLAGSLTTFLLLWGEWSGFRARFSPALWRKIIAYSAPFIIIGLGGMVNETLDRWMLRRLLPVSAEKAKAAVGIYGANYRISIVITLFIQAFRMAAEPFFFAQSADKNAPKTYARVMKWFVITLCVAFLFTALFLDIWKYMIGRSYRGGLGVVPILLYANLALGIYYNLAVWYKVSNRLGWGIAITLMGAALTLGINYAFIPRYGMWACAWATAICYASMMVVSYIVGQRHFPVPYNTKKLLSYLGVMSVLFAAQCGVNAVTGIAPVRIASGAVLMGMFLLLIAKAERAELKSFPVVGRFF